MTELKTYVDGDIDNHNANSENDVALEDLSMNQQELKKSRRGKNTLENAEPERQSVRLANRKGTTSSTKEDEHRAKALKQAASDRIWKDCEKEQLLNGLRSHGSKNWRTVSEHVPTKRDDMVKAAINREKRNHLFTIKTIFKKDDDTEIVIDDGEQKSSGRPPGSRREVKEEPDGPTIRPEGHVEEILVRRKRNAPVEQWQEIMERHEVEEVASLKVAGSNQTCSYSSSLPRSLNWIANMEQHPDPKACGGIDYAAIYRYLAYLCQGEAPPDLDPPTAARVAGLLPMLVGVMKKMDLRKEGEWLENYRGPHSVSTYIREPGFDPNSESVKTIERLSKIPGLNPLGIDAEMCVDRVIPFPKQLYV